MLTLAPRIGVVEAHTVLACICDGVASRPKVSRTSLVADGPRTARPGMTVDGSYLSGLARRVSRGWESTDEAGGSEHESKGVHLE